MFSFYFYSSILTIMILILIGILLSNWTWILNFNILNMGTLSFDMTFFLEQYSSAFLSTVLTIFLMVYLYSFSYLSEEIFLKRFLSILSLFVFSMCTLILSGNLFSSLIGWDGLGVTSMFLILFYYSKSALKASKLTFLMNRVGDCFFILALIQTLLLGSPVSVSFTSIAVLLVLTSITKSAQIPFSTWLPAAMEAPTPVSALVHSSTLVTAGIYLLFRYSNMWVENTLLKSFLLILSISTCFMAALSALVESDLKKLIALSTLSQLGFIMFSFSLELLKQGFTHMLMHAYFKALLFMCAGLVIHSFKGSQTISMLSLSNKQNPLILIIISSSLLSMSGLPFLSGFYSKDLILDSMKEAVSWAIIVYTLLVLSFLCTSLYSMRLLWFLLNSSSSWHSMSVSDINMVKPMIPLVGLALAGGSLVTWTLVEMEFYMETSKVFILMLMLLCTSWYLLMVKDLKSSTFLESKWHLNTFNPILSNAFFNSSKAYSYSCDLSGIPESINSLVKSTAMLASKKGAHTMIHYWGSWEFLLFLASILLLL